MADRLGSSFSELALETASEMRRIRRDGVALDLVSSETRPLEAFGSEASLEVSALLEINGITFLGDTEPISFDGAELMTSRGPMATEEAVVLPRLTGRRIGGIPFDGAGFVPDGAGADDSSDEVVVQPNAKIFGRYLTPFLGSEIHG